MRKAHFDDHHRAGVLRSTFHRRTVMPFAPWLIQPEPKDEEPLSDPNDPSLLVNILKPEPGDKPIDWFLDHLEVGPPQND
jgi:hypothetical protein